MDIRAYTPQDYTGVFALESQCFEQHSASQYMELYLTSPEHFFIAIEEEVPVGYVSGWEDGNMGRIFSLGVSHSYRRGGIGTALFQRFLKSLPSTVTWIALEVRANNVAARRLYEKFGFTLCHVLRNYYLDGEDGFLMVRAR